ncbi:RxLR-like protein [Plasmopara halstedii]|uniref:RxLR-like protein n=1 Tax=Plasmopara halstedii TaxID=4781 RepID=A0A0P1AZK1_PLAHL|nr:RxLR-like protein [Plasmopara halstedii]CEG46774.1 RxLR-like protein [Plasmopara halstedii]|eukprot:XP_024583143.1 RxLR-like protein [Plasmopara halstedii]
MGFGRFFLFGVAIVVALVALAWPQLEHLLINSGYSCPYPFSMLITGNGTENEAAVETKGLPKYTLDQLRMYDGSDEKAPILLAVGGKVLDVTSGAKFYGKGNTYNLFAGTACTRALALGSLEIEDISDDTSDFDESKLKELAETKQFYYEKYPIVGELV